MSMNEEAHDMSEQEAFTAYIEAIGRTVGYDASIDEARAACPEEFGAWRAIFIAQYGYDPAV